MSPNASPSVGTAMSAEDDTTAPSTSSTDTRQLVVVFVWLLFGWIIASGLLTLLPIHATNLGATPDIVGYYLAFAYVMIACGSLSAGWIMSRLPSLRAFLIICTAGIPLGTAAMIWANDMWSLAAATGLAWLCFGLITPGCNALVARSCAPEDRGRVFGIVAMPQGLGPLIGGAIMGPAADAWGYGGMFLVATLVGCVFLASSLLLRDVRHSSQDPKAAPNSAALPGLRYWAFLGSGFLVAISAFVFVIARPLVMSSVGFSATAISATESASGLALLVFMPAFGWLSDRWGRLRILAICYIVGALALATLSLSASYWPFVVGGILRAICNARAPTQRALAADALTDESLGMGMALLASSGWVGGIIGFGLAGRSIAAWGSTSTLRAAALLPVIGLLVLLAARPDKITSADSREACNSS